MSKPSGEPSFETALAELEKIVARMEAGELSLEEALATHKRGLELAKYLPAEAGGRRSSKSRCWRATC